MTGMDLYRAIGEIDDRFIVEAEQVKKSLWQSGSVRRALAAAASLLFCLGIYGGICMLQTHDANSGASRSSDVADLHDMTAETAEELPEEAAGRASQTYDLTESIEEEATADVTSGEESDGVTQKNEICQLPAALSCEKALADPEFGWYVDIAVPEDFTFSTAIKYVTEEGNYLYISWVRGMDYINLSCSYGDGAEAIPIERLTAEAVAEYSHIAEEAGDTGNPGISFTVIYGDDGLENQGVLLTVVTKGLSEEEVYEMLVK